MPTAFGQLVTVMVVSLIMTVGLTCLFTAGALHLQRSPVSRRSRVLGCGALALAGLYLYAG